MSSISGALSRPKALFRSDAVQRFLAFGALLVLIVVFTLLSPNFLKFDNVIGILLATSVNGILALGVTFVIITGGIDVGAKEEIYRLLNDLASQGKSIIMISSELPEVLRMSHRVVVMSEGRVTGQLDAAEATQESVMHLATLRPETEAVS